MPQVSAAGQNCADFLCSLKSRREQWSSASTYQTLRQIATITVLSHTGNKTPREWPHALVSANINSVQQFSLVKKQKKTTQKEYIHDWQHNVTQLKKWTYFHRIKSDFKLAPYLSSITDYRQRKLLNKYCMSEHSLSVETSRAGEPESSDCSHSTDGAIEVHMQQI